MAAHTWIKWESIDVSSPSLEHSVECIAALNVPYVQGAHRFQTLSIYLAADAEATKLVDTPFGSIPAFNDRTETIETLVYIHGGAWRAYDLTSQSIKPTVAHAFSSPNAQITTIVAINYTLSPSAENVVVPVGYDPIADNHSDPSREAIHPGHVADVLQALAFLRSLGLNDNSYILCGHSCGACISLQVVLQNPAHWGFDHSLDPPCPTAAITLNGLYDLTQLVHGLGSKHQHLREDYMTLIGKAFGLDEKTWEAASPARFDAGAMSVRVRDGKAPSLVLLDHSEDDQLAPLNGTERMALQLSLVDGMTVLRGKRSKGKHAEIWEKGEDLWNTVEDVLEYLKNKMVSNRGEDIITCN